jgi:hypothetical protein
MSQDQGQKPAAPISRAEAKTPLERARQIQEMQRQMDTQAPQAATQAAPTQQAEAPQQMERVQQTHEVFEAKPVTPADQAAKAQPAEIQAYAKAQAPVQALFDPGGQVEISGNPWKVIPFGDVLPGIVDTKKPLSDFNVKVPDQAFKIPQGRLFQITLSPKNPATGGETIKKPVLTDENGKFKGAEFKNTGQVQKALGAIPSFASSLLEAVFGDLSKEEPKNLKLGEVKLSEKSMFQIEVGRRNDMTGKWKTELVHLNNFGMKVKASNEPTRFNIVVANYFKDGFTAQ